MRWTPGGTSSNIEDRRGEGGGGGLGGGGFKVGGPMGIGGALIVLVLSLIFGGDIFSGGGAPSSPAAQQSGGEARPATESAAEKTEVQFVSFVLDDAQKRWREILTTNGATYRDAKLVLFRDAVRTACGDAPSAAGPFYCPTDQKVYLDLGFFDELKSRFGAAGDFAQAYVITHELGHHVQRLLGTESRVRQLMEQHPDQQNELSVRLELQADCYAGVWANTTDQRGMLEQGDPEEALGAASAVGDDRIQQSMRGSVHPESFTHGSSEQRVTWFKRGFRSGDMRNCDTFAGAR
jgi:predicted metalloprotease